MKNALCILAFGLSFLQAALAEEVGPLLQDGPLGRPPMEGRFVSSPLSVSPKLLELPSIKSGATPSPDKPFVGGPVQIGFSRRTEVQTLGKATSIGRTWFAVGDEQVTVILVKSPGAAALRAGIVLDDLPSGLRVAVGSRLDWEGEGRAIVLTDNWIRETYAQTRDTMWTPVTEGDQQVIEIRVPASSKGEPLSIHLVDVSHLTESPFALSLQPKLLQCHQNYTCATDPAIAQAGKAVAKLVITSNGATGVCTGALLNDRSSSGTPWFATANHCMSAAGEAASVQFLWFFEQACGGSTISPAYTTSVGSLLSFTDKSVDFTLLRVTGGLPSGVVRLGWDPANLVAGAAIYGIHHPVGNPPVQAPKAYSTGQFAQVDPSITFRGADPNVTWNISSNTVTWQVGITEQGSSGSPLMTGAGVFRGALSAGPTSQSCTSTPRTAYYSRFSEIYPRIRSFIDPLPVVPDEANSAAATLTSQASDYTFGALNARLNYPDDQDWFRFRISQAGVWIVYTTAEANNPSTDTVGRFFLSDGTTDSGIGDDDGTPYAPNFLMGAHTSPGTYYVRVTGKGGATGPYVLVSVFIADDDHSNFYSLADPLGTNASVTGVINYGGDSDKFAIDVTTSGTLRVASGGNTDVVGLLYDSSLRQVAFNDDVTPGVNVNFSLSAAVTAGRYYLDVIGYDVGVTGAYSVQTTFTPGAIAPNYTALWWNPAESGWGINFNHQGNIVFGTLFTYDAAGVPLWLVMSNGAMQPDGVTFTGDLYRTTGPAFNANPFTPIGAANLTRVGSMTVSFLSVNTASLRYTVNGVAVSKSIQRQVYGTRAANCTPTTGSRASLTNYQDLWWNPAESGWGVNVTHQDNTLFATLFTYDATGRDLWLVLSSGNRQSDSSYLGDLYRTSGPPFNANPFTPIGAGNLTVVGTMRFRFIDGNNATLIYTYNGVSVTKAITRQVFSSPVPSCS